MTTMSNQNNSNVQVAKINWSATILAALIGALFPSAGVIVNFNSNKETSKTIQGVKTEIEDIKSSASSIQGFRSATYEDKNGNKYQVFGPAKIDDAEDQNVERQMWTIQSESSDFTASWISGEPKGNPKISNLKIASLLSGSFAYGLVGNTSSRSATPYGEWYGEYLIGVQQNGNQLLISKFHNKRSGYKPNNTIDAQYILTLTLVEQD